ncbi:MAG: VOC family protein [Lysobacter sp.]
MSSRFQRIAPFLWFDDQAESAIELYTSIFDNSRIVATTRYTADSSRAAGRPEGSVMTVAFQLDGQDFTAINGGPHFKFNEAISLMVNCRSQDEIDYYWSRLGDGGDERSQECGWLKDRFGLSWQVVPQELIDLLGDADAGRAQRATQALLKMKKIDLNELRRAAG